MIEHPPRKVKIVATIGPASDSRGMIERLARRGVNIFRLNLSHRTHEESARVVAHIRAVEKKLKKPIAVMGDLAGPKIRIGVVDPPLVLHVGQTIKIFGKPVNGSAEGISLNFPNIVARLKKGMEVYLDDGLLKFEVVGKIAGGVTARVVIGGTLKSRKGFSVQGLSLGKFALSVKDKADIRSMITLGADALAVSFVQDKEDVEAIIKMLPKEKRPMVIAKIETKDAVHNSEEILEIADGLMIARGDLGLSVPMAEIPFIQKNLIRLGLKKAKPIITATQMLESMIYNPLPTRAEVTDVTKAILDGTDAVMLSGETAAGKYPEEAVRMMTDIIDTASPRIRDRDFPEAKEIPDAVGASAVHVACQINSRLIIVCTESGSTAKRIARHRYGGEIIALTQNSRILRQLNFTWGVFPVLIRSIRNFDELIPLAESIARKNAVLKMRPKEPFVISAGVPFGKSGGTNLLFVGKA